MKRILCLILAALMMVSVFAGCTTGNVKGEVSQNSEGEFGLGKAQGNTYKNEFLGLECSLPDSWSFYNDSQIAELNGVAQDYLDEDAAEALENANIIYDMYASNGDDYSSININLEKLSTTQSLTMSVKEALEAQLPTIKQAFGNMGYENVSAEYTTVTVDEKTFDGITLCAEIEGVKFYEKIFSFKKGSYMANITVATMETDKSEEILKYFEVK